MLVQNLQCNGSHGISVGSLGQYVGETDLVENVYVYNVSMSNASDGARIKVWPGSPAELSGDLQGGGGTGAVRNVTYDTMSVENVAYGIEVTQCYGQKNITLCNQFPVRSPLIVVRPSAIIHCPLILTFSLSILVHPHDNRRRFQKFPRHNRWKLLSTCR